MSYRKYGIERSRIDILLHAISYYALRHTLLNAGNYETGLGYFPVRFLPEIREKLPSVYSAIFSPGSIDFGKYQSIVFILAWEVKRNEHLARYYTPVKSKGNLTLWRRNS
jgi:hypothetical protein